MIMRSVSVLCTTMLLASCSALLTPSAGIPVPTPSAGQEIFVIDPSHTFPHFEISHLGFSLHRGRFNKTVGWIALDRKARTGALELRVDADSIDTGDSLVEERLRLEDFFDVVNHPTIHFKSDKLHFDGETLKRVDGDLTIRGVTRPVTLAVTAFRCGKRPITRQDMCGANAEAAIKRLDFGVGPSSASIGHDVKLTVQIEAIKR